MSWHQSAVTLSEVTAIDSANPIVIFDGPFIKIAGPFIKIAGPFIENVGSFIEFVGLFIESVGLFAISTVASVDCVPLTTDDQH